MRHRVLLAAIILSSCLRNSVGAPTPEEAEDKSIIFPEFSAEFPVVIGEKESPYELDGVTLRAIMLAANDYIPPSAQRRECWQTQEAQNYRVIRRGDLIFVGITVNPYYCKESLIPLDEGMRYAISIDGRILRRLATGEPEGSRLLSSDAGVGKTSGQPVPKHLVGVLSGPSQIPPQWRKDGGSPASPESQPHPPQAPDGGPSGDGGSPADGGARPGPGL
jgi:hypothetical protein